MIIKTFGENLYLLRKENKLTQEEIATSLNVTRQTISNWETDNVKPTIDKVIGLSEIYGVSLDTLIGKEISEARKVSPIFKKYEGARGILYMKPTQDQPFFPSHLIKNVEIGKVNDISIEIRIHKKEILSQLIFIKDILGFLKEVN